MTPDHDVIVLASTRTAIEDQLVRDWVRAEVEPVHRSVQVVTLPTPAASAKAFAELGSSLAGNDDVLLLPAHVVWRPGEKDGHRRVAISDLVRIRNPYRPSSRHQRAIAQSDPDRAPVIAGVPATVAFLRQRYVESHHGDVPDDEQFGRHVARRARVGLERADRVVLGPEFRSPGFLTEEILHSARFRQGLHALAQRIGADEASEGKAEEILEELATGWGRLFVDLVPRIDRMVFQRGFDPTIDVLPEELDRLRDTMSATTVVFLWSHRSNLDTPVLNVALHENGLPLPHLFAGINMAFGPMGPILRRCGTIFIRRSFGGDELDKYVLKEFVGYLTEKRFNLSWSIEGTRSRTGKMLPPKLGLLGYTAEAYLDGRADDVSLQPVSITFDQLHEIGEYANYARGGRKAAEGMSWLLGFIKAQGERNFGKIYVRFPEPVSLRASLGAPGGETTTDEDARRLALQKTAFEVAWRINGATPVTSVALVTTVLLGTKGMALTTSQVHTALEGVFAYLDARHVPVVDSVAGLRDLSGVEATLLTLAGPGGVVTRVEGARDTVWRIETKNQLAATFYRNSIIHVFLISALCEIAMVLAAHEPADSDRVEAFWAHVHNLRDLLKFEFYFKDRAEFRAHVEQEVSRSGGDWEQMLRTDPVDIAGLLAQRAPLTASFMLRPFIEAYLIIADVVTRIDGEVDRPAAVKEGLALGEQFLAQKRIDSAEPVSALLFETGLKVMDNRGLLAPAPDRTERVEDFEQKLEQVLRAILEIERLTFDLFIADRRVRRGGR
jgi:glycerol-3-phosphate O-acyltransferase